MLPLNPCTEQMTLTWSHVHGGPAAIAQGPLCTLQFHCKAKVADLDVSIVIYENVLGLQIPEQHTAHENGTRHAACSRVPAAPVDNVLIVHVTQSTCELAEVEHGHWLFEFGLLADAREQLTSCSVVKHQTKAGVRLGQ